VNIKEQIEKALGLPVTAGNIVGVDYQCNAAFAMAKQQKRLPMEIAIGLVNQFNSINKAVAATASPPGFVNFRVNDAALETVATGILQTGRLPLASQAPRTVFFDYGGANIAKQLHIGNLRSPIIGEALKRVFHALGHKTVSDSFFGDWGLPMGLVLAQLESDGISEITYENLAIAYPKSSTRSKTDAEFMAQAQEITALLQKKAQPWYTKWQKIREVSIASVMKIYNALDCTFDTLGGESFASEYVPATLETLKKHGATTSDGCLILNVKRDDDTAPMPPVILQKANDGVMYATTDIAMMNYRWKTYKPSELIFVTDFRQELHFEQVFRAAKKGGVLPTTAICKHVSYGTINGTDGKAFKTRSGGTMPVDEIFEMLETKAMEKMKNSNRDTARFIGLAALKFADLSNHVRKDYVFDIERFTSFEGKTGPYLLYTVARINSIFKKAKVQPKFKFQPTMRDVIISVVRLADSYPTAAANYTLNGLVDATYEVAAAFNLLYTKVTMSNDPAYLALCELVRTALLFALDTLAIQPVDEM